MIKTLDILKSYFVEYSKPSQSQFADLIDSFHHKDSGQIILGHTQKENGDIEVSLSDGEKINIPKSVLPDQKPLTFIEGLVDALEAKVSKQPGKQLSDENFTTELKGKLENLQNYTHPEKHSISEIKNLSARLNSLVKKEEGKQLSDENFSGELKEKLEILQNYTPPSSVPISYVEGLLDLLKDLETTLSQKVDIEDGKTLSSNDFSDTFKEKLENLKTSNPNLIPMAGGMRILPTDAFVNFGHGSKNGALKIIFPNDWTNSMFSMEFHVFDYRDNLSSKIFVSAYQRKDATYQRWESVTYSLSTSKENTDFRPTLRFGHNGTKPVIYIGELNQRSFYPKIVVKDIFRYDNNNQYASAADWLSGWTFGLETENFQNIDKTITA
ncbi:hypothetical protein HN014_08165 [Aquimarina sp. TRL1]|uniref:hypothetical protein n=1 Tax=Aquimarina sp. (strain TRL1) TaxID=2736252 RepID=UPI00158BD985|nr:hypothetical protein [Aquimarina sp. TRL1]QKX04893.1 hypothetical protein HN014_08165 [Aquimarina sp. TRL1]